MKKTYHLCLSAGDEIMFRDLEDYHRGFNCFACALHKTDSTGLVESFMSTHTHQLIQTHCPDEFMYNFRQTYAMFFNKKYHRRGPLGEKHHFTMEIVGYHHILAAASYTLRNALHHGVAPIPYAYPHCSANAIFSKEMGKTYSAQLLPQSSYYKYIGRRCIYPNTYKMTVSGVFTRESVLDIPQVESLYITPRAFNFYMSRKSSEEWESEQQKDSNNHASINLEVIERGVDLHTTSKMLSFESGKADYKKYTDIELCTELDTLARTQYGRHSVYELSLKEKEAIAEYLYKIRRLSESQIRRCLVLPKGR